jgi:hypothetical protein
MDDACAWIGRNSINEGRHSTPPTGMPGAAGLAKIVPELNAHLLSQPTNISGGNASITQLAHGP